MKGQGIVLAVQDTTGLNYTHHPKKEGMGSIGTKAPELRGLWIEYDSFEFCFGYVSTG